MAGVRMASILNSILDGREQERLLKLAAVTNHRLWQPGSPEVLSRIPNELSCRRQQLMTLLNQIRGRGLEYLSMLDEEHHRLPFIPHRIINVVVTLLQLTTPDHSQSLLLCMVSHGTK